MITRDLMERIFPTKGLNPSKYNLVKYRAELVDALNEFLPKYKINTYRRVCAFFANCGIETDYFRTTSEYASGADYEGRKNLGNTQPGDGRKFKGRGLTQTTGRYNYGELNKAAGKRLGVDFLKNPEKLNEIKIAVESACIFWDDHDLNKYADAKRFKELGGIVNKGDVNATPMHWEKRNALYSLCLRRVAQDFSFGVAEKVEAKPIIVPTPSPDEVIVATTTTTITTPTVPVEAIPVAKEATLSELTNKYLKHFNKDSVKNVAQVVGARGVAGVVAMWSSGFHGKLLTALIGIAILAPTVYALYFYHARIIKWAKSMLISAEDEEVK